MFSFLKRKKILFIGIILFLLLGFFGYFQTLGKKNQIKPDKTTVRKGSLEEKLTISGEIDATEKTTLRFQTSGRLSWVGVKEGDIVKKYQSVASLDKREVEKNLKKKLLAYMDERWTFEQAQDDKSVFGRRRVDVPGLTDAERRILDQAQFHLDSTVLDVEIQSLALEYSLLWTPIDGIVTRIGQPFSGVNITPANAEFDILNPKTFFFSATADQSEVVKLSEGMAGQLVLDSYPESTMSGTIANISFIPKSGETSTSYKVKFVFPLNDSTRIFRLGMGGDLTVVTKHLDDVLYIPIKYVKSENGKKYVFVQKANKSEKNFITTGMETDDYIQIISGLSEGDFVYSAS